MTIYSIVIIALIMLFLVEQSNDSSNFRKALFFISAFLVFFIMAFRGENVGGDTIGYVRFWQGKYDQFGTWEKPSPLLIYEPGLSWLCYFLHLFCEDDSWFFLCFTSLLTLAPLFYLIWRDCKFKVLPILLYVIMWGLLDITYTAIRQVVGVSFVIIAYIIWTTGSIRKNVKYLLVIFLLVFAISFHTVVYFSVVIYIVMLFVRKIHKRASIIILLSTLLFGIVYTNFIPQLFNYVETLISGIDLLFRYDQYFTIKYSLNTNVIGLQQVLTCFLICIIVYLSEEDKNTFATNCLILGCSLYNIFAPFPNATRFLYPLMIVGIIVSPPKMNIKNYLNYKFILFALLLALSINKINGWEYKFADKGSDAYLSNHLFPYKFVWE